MDNNEANCEALLDERTRSLISSTILSVVRDRLISSSYGFLLSQSEGLSPSLLIDELFSDAMAEKLKVGISECFGEGALIWPLYSGEGDLYSQFLRLLLVCNEMLQEETDIICEADEKISKLGIICRANGGKYIEHLRNAMMHGHCKVECDATDPFLTQFKLWDEVSYGNKREQTAEFVLTVNDMNDLIDILIRDVCLRYLKQVDWTLA